MSLEVSKTRYNPNRLAIFEQLSIIQHQSCIEFP